MVDSKSGVTVIGAKGFDMLKLDGMQICCLSSNNYDGAKQIVSCRITCEITETQNVTKENN